MGAVIIKRSVIQIANSTQLISLPRKWSKKYNIQKGDELEVEEQGTKLSITTETIPKINAIEVDVSGLTPRLVDRFLARSYQKGYDRITLNFDKQEIIATIQNKVPELLGFEIMSQTKNSCVVESISAKLNINFDNALRKAFLIILEMGDICLEAFKNGDTKTLENLHYKDYDVNKFCYFCLRSINKGHHEGFGTYVLYYLIESLEDVGDEYKALAKHLSKTTSNKKKLLNILSRVNRLTKLSYDFFYKPSKEISIEFIKLYNKIKEEAIGLMASTNIHEVTSLNSIDIISRLIYHFPTMRLDTLKGLGGN